MNTSLKAVLKQTRRVLYERSLKHRHAIAFAYWKLAVFHWLGLRPTQLTVAGMTVWAANSSDLATLFEEIFVLREYRLEVTTKSPRIIDGGANIGLVAVFLKLQYPEASIECFEPDAENFALLQRNIQENDLKKVTLHQTGLARKPGSHMYFGGGTGGSLLDLNKQSRAYDVPEQTAVKVEPLIPYLRQKVDYLKLDIEGSEGMVLESIAMKLGQVKRMTIEFHQMPANLSLPKLLELLETHGHRYEVRKWHYLTDFGFAVCLIETCLV